ncbi:hypothetical protein [Rhizobium laguerreae]|uniref:hypothetical protein n=1 Tax=Rhizobium laguerreae TaxID=1076926 RepID=UPI00143F4864|nr:hypothetical protein [Rhizobium laguerreae]
MVEQYLESADTLREGDWHRQPFLSLNCLKSSVSSFVKLIMTPESAFSCSIRAFLFIRILLEQAVFLAIAARIVSFIA